MARAAFPVGDLAVSGLHTVFGHHAAQGSREALAAFLHENRIMFPVAIDRPGDAEGVPKTMPAYGMRGTPTRLLIDRGAGCASTPSASRTTSCRAPTSWR